MNRKLQIHGGGTESEEWIACSAKVMKTEVKWWRHIKATKVFTDIQGAIDSIA